MAPDHDDGPPSASDFGGLVARVDELDRTVREVVESNSVLHVGHRLLIEQMAELRVSQRDADIERRQLAEAVRENTDLTRESVTNTRETRDLVQVLRDVQAAGRLSARVGRITGRVVLRAAAIVTALAGGWYAITHGGPKP